MNFFEAVSNNNILLVSLLAWFIAQSLKVIHTYLVDKRFNVSRFVGSGGMPSSHSAFVMALTTSIGLTEGWDSPLFALSFGFAMVVMYDAAGVRNAVGKQAVIINKMIADLHNKNKKQLKQKNEKRLKELVGHTPFEVLVGGILGIIIAILIV
ncbi:divergent PAP2 family protein [Serpentinicella sp. ANB-PHB4]|uniref:divergent PAP2 family protein n=1 Tax=Serpentinicella sp. ANB-PHB4 TaxID=3074076 RepID=UPI00286717CF|nr:divergent PAP2 family protein [Serpentinicella sp. ANB-PHB4]MDR5658186.1 divergent PAP2 family protein [Serpentinicella sp. ANB-PHB4]